MPRSKKLRPTICTARAATVFREMLSYRQIYCNEKEFFLVSDFWEFLTEGNDETKIKTYRTRDMEEYKRKAGVIAFGNLATLVVDEQLMKNAKSGCKFSNTILAHEFAHLALGHHEKNRVIKNFQLFETDSGMANLPPNEEELEANLAAVFFQCGTYLLDQRINTLDLSRRACADVSFVRHAKSLCSLDVFQDELKKQLYGITRVIL